MSVLRIPFGQSWAIRTPVVVREMDEKYVDAFFKTGALRISSFELFRRHSDEARRDGEEGCASMEITYPNATSTGILFNGQEAYVLCASTIEPTLGVGRGGLVINDTIAFAAAIARYLPGFVGGTEGLCAYRSNTSYQASEPGHFEPPGEGSDPEEWARRHERFLGEHMQRKFFIKHSRFAHEAEYRMIWFCSGKPKDFIDIECSEAIQFCKPMRT